MRIKERIAAEKKAAQDILAKGEENLTDEEFEQLKQHVSEAKKLEERAALLKDGAEILDNAAGGKNPEQKKEENAVTAKSIGEHFANELKAKGLDAPRRRPSTLRPPSSTSRPTRMSTPPAVLPATTPRI